MSALQDYLARHGATAELARGLKLSHAAIAQWKQVPAKRVVDVERLTGIPREALRPDLYRREPEPETRPATAAA